jgi:hypothetical protein
LAVQAVRCELVSERYFPVRREETGNLSKNRHFCAIDVEKTRSVSVRYLRNSLRERTGNFFDPSREYQGKIILRGTATNSRTAGDPGKVPEPAKATPN